MRDTVNRRTSVRLGLVAALIAGTTIASGATAKATQPSAHGWDIAVPDYWTPTRRSSAVPLDLFVDQRGKGHRRTSNGTLEPYGGARPEGRSVNPTMSSGKRGPGGRDVTGPAIDALDPAGGTVTEPTREFSAVVTDPSGVPAVTFVVSSGTSSQELPAQPAGGDTWTASVSGLSDGVWTWYVVATDGARKVGNTSTSAPVSFSVDLGGSITASLPWTDGGPVETAAGRLYLEFPDDRAQSSWSAYVCSGTVVTDGAGDRSIVLTAAHCVYDDVDKSFARNVLFIPDQVGTTGAGTDVDCSNDPLGCWVPSFGVVDADWAGRTFPFNIPWDYAFYVVPDAGAHSGTEATSDALDAAAGSLLVQFAPPMQGGTAHALGYSYSEDPKLMYCSDSIGVLGLHDWWLPGCHLTGGASGGPWLQPVAGGSGPVVSINSFGLLGLPGMAGPRFSGSSAFCLFLAANLGAPSTDRGAIPLVC